MATVSNNNNKNKNKNTSRKNNPLQTLIAGHCNLDKSSTCNKDFSNHVQKIISRQKKECIFGLQEPNVNRRSKKISVIPNKNLIYSRNFTGVDDEPRAALFVSDSVRFHYDPMFTERDMATGLWLTGDSLVPKVMVTSVYMHLDYKPAPWPPKFLKLVNHCFRNNLELLVLCDANSWSPMWGMDRTNQRGRIMEELILEKNFHVINVGGLPDNYTYSVTNTKTIIDIAFCTNNLKEIISNWKVMDIIVTGKHRLCQFEITVNEHDLGTYRNFRKGSWTRFQQLLEEIDDTAIEEWDIDCIETQTNKLIDDIMTSLDVTHPLCKRKSKAFEFKWYDAECVELSKTIHKTKSRWRSTGDRRFYDQMKDQQQQYHRLIRDKGRENWKDKVESCNNFRLVAQLNNAMKRNSLNLIGLMTNDLGDSFTDPMDSINKLASVHFIDSTEVPPEEILPSVRNVCSIDDERVDFITEQKVREAFDMFGDFKAPGPDGFQPIVFKHLSNKAIKRIVCIYKASVLLGYTPKKWRISNVIFLPKPGKANYADPKSYRPISLMTYFLKALERLFLWRMQETAFRDFPMSVNQNGFRKGKSTESALTNTIEYIEDAIINVNYALAVFLDIAAAFDSVTTELMIQGLHEKGVDQLTIDWCEQFLRNRSIKIDYKGVQVTRYLMRGTPQGGVLSPILWNLAFDGFLKLFQDGDDVNVVGFADDACLVTQGKDPYILIEKMQIAMNRALNWGQQSDLTFSTTKTVVVLFTRKRKVPKNLPRIKMGNVSVPYSETVKYLGLHLDKGLYWTHHVKTKINSCKKLLLMVRNATGKVWGYSPQNSLWSYKAMVRNAFTYGSMLWVIATERKTIRDKLNSLQRLALTNMGNFRLGTPTAGLEVITHTMPLWLHVRQEAIMSFIRTRDSSKYEDGYLTTENQLTKVGHRQYIEEYLNKIGYVLPNSDDIIPIFNWDQKYHLDINSFKEGIPSWEGDIICFTDGSKDAAQRTGSGVAIYKANKEILHESSWHLGKYLTVFQSEIHAIKKCVDFLLCEGHTNRKIIIHSDSQASLKAITSNQIKATSVNNVVILLNELAGNNEIWLRWVKAHVNHDGNENADRLAKIGASEIVELAVDVPLHSASSIRSDVRTHMVQQWQNWWENHPWCRQTKMFFPKLTVAKRKGTNLTTINRKSFTNVIWFLTGHNHFNRHNSIVDQVDEPEYASCRYCEQEEESSFHLFAQCDKFAIIRQKWFGSDLLSPPFEFNNRNLLGYLKEAQFVTMTDWG